MKYLNQCQLFGITKIDKILKNNVRNLLTSIPESRLGAFLKEKFSSISTHSSSDSVSYESASQDFYNTILDTVHDVRYEDINVINCIKYSCTVKLGYSES